MKYFLDSEFVRFDLLRPEMKEKLDQLREGLGSPIIITSSYRDPVHNLAVGGARDSSHTPSDQDGLYSGIDFTLPGGRITARALDSLLMITHAIGFRRRGLYFDGRHMHIDCEVRLDQDVVWIK